MSIIYRMIVVPYRIIHPLYRNRPLASTVVIEYIRSRSHPTWTSFFLPYRFVQDDHFGAKHFNLTVDNVNYHILRIGCFPYIKYHCTSRPYTDLYYEDLLWRVITVVNLGIPCLLYGIAASLLITHTDIIITKGTQIPIHFLIKENCMTIILSTSPLEYNPTIYAWLILLFLVFPLIGLSYKVISTVLVVLLRCIYSLYLWIYYEPNDRASSKEPPSDPIKLNSPLKSNKNNRISHRSHKK